MWLTSKDKIEQVPLPNRSWLFNPNGATSGIHQNDIIAANDGVEEALDRDNSPAKRRKEGSITYTTVRLGLPLPELRKNVD